MFRIKVCGITNSGDGVLVAAAGADAIGLNFYPPSPRYVSMATAEQIVEAHPARVAKVGLFVDAPAKQIHELADHFMLDWIQLHGDEPPELLTELETRRVIRAFRLGPNGVLPVAGYLERCLALGRLPDAVLVDAWHPDLHGGTGQVGDWSLLAGSRDWLAGLPLVLAGGLNPTNVGEAIHKVHPDAVDVASGVEIQRRLKDPRLVHDFVAAACTAFASQA